MIFKNMSRFLSEKLKTLSPYTPGEQPKNMAELIKLNTNESPFCPSPRVIEAISAQEVSALRLYSDPECGALTGAAAEYHGVLKAQVLPGNGSDEILALIFHGLCQNGAAFADITYGFYRVYCNMFNVSANIIPLREDFSVAVEDYADLSETIFIANPNAPTGVFLPISDIERILRLDKNRLVVVDEAYVEFGGESSDILLEKYDNLLIVRTLSKAHSLAGARVGYALGSEDLIKDLNTLRFSLNPYNVNRLSLLAGKAALDDREYFETCRARIIENRDYTTKSLRALGFLIPESRANFIFAGDNTQISAADYYRRLRESGILVRYFASPRIDNYVRITIGSMEQMERLIEVTKELLS